MNAIEELRETVKDSYQVDGIKLHTSLKLHELIDRIDTEYMELPRDKNGEVIHLGDTIRGYSGSVGKVIALRDSGDVVITRGDYNAIVVADTYELAKPDSMEQIKADAAKSFNQYWCCKETDCTECMSTKKYPDVEMCSVAERLDLIARTEKLLGGEQE